MNELVTKKINNIILDKDIIIYWEKFPFVYSSNKMKNYRKICTTQSRSLLDKIVKINKLDINIISTSFSYSHTFDETYVFLGISKTGKSIGIDAEPINRLISDSLFSKFSLKCFSNKSDLLRFFQYSEAFYKCSGKIPINKLNSEYKIELTPSKEYNVFNSKIGKFQILTCTKIQNHN